MSVLARALARCGIIDQKEAAAPPDTLSFSNAITRACTPNQLMGQTLDSIERLAAVSRHRLSADMWRMFNHLMGELQYARPAAAGDADAMLEFCDQMIRATRSEETTSEIQSLICISYVVLCLTNKKLCTNIT